MTIPFCIDCTFCEQTQLRTGAPLYRCHAFEVGTLDVVTGRPDASLVVGCYDNRGSTESTACGSTGALFRSGNR